MELYEGVKDILYLLFSHNILCRGIGSGSNSPDRIAAWMRKFRLFRSQVCFIPQAFKIFKQVTKKSLEEKITPTSYSLALLLLR